MGTDTEKNKICRGTLYLTATPIGNLADITDRAKKILSEVDFIAAEDTRNTARLLKSYSITKPLTSYHEHNMRTATPKIIERLQRGEACALVTDAGMPAISDPGELLVAQCAARGIEVAAVPGPSAVITALAVSGLPTGRFTFEGFLSTAKKSRRDHLEQLRDERRTMVFYEAPHKLAATLKDLERTFGPSRRIALVRELTKLHEEAIRTTLGEACERFAAEAPRGEFVLVLEGASEEPERLCATPEDAVALAKELCAQGMSASEAAKRAARESGVRKGEIYAALVSPGE